MTNIEQARFELAKWEARIAYDTAALEEAERDAIDARKRLESSTRVAAGLRKAVRVFDDMQAAQAQKGEHQ